jgi:predicted nucleotidyltransferase
VKFKCSRKELELDPEIKNWFRINLPIYPGGTSDKYESLELAEFLDQWRSFVIRKPFISLVGSLANWDRTEGDIDILVKAKDPSPLLKALDRAVATLFEKKEDALADLMIQIYQFIHTDSVFLNAKWRIERAFPDWVGRLQILDDSFSGPFTNFVELADLVAVSREEKERQEMAQMKKLKLFEFFKMLKPIHGRKKEEMYSVDSVIDTIKSRKDDWFETGIYVEKKFDGVHAQAHVMKDYESGKIARVITEEGTVITTNCPTLREELRKITGEFILCGEIELWKDGKHQPRADCAGVLNSKEVHQGLISLTSFGIKAKTSTICHSPNVSTALIKLPT